MWEKPHAQPKFPKHVFFSSCRTMIQKIFVRIKNNVYSDDDPSGRVPALSIHILFSLIQTHLVCVCVISGLLKTITVQSLRLKCYTLFQV